MYMVLNCIIILLGSHDWLLFCLVFLFEWLIIVRNLFAVQIFIRHNITNGVGGAGKLSRLEDSVEENNSDPRWIPLENKRSAVWEHYWIDKEDKTKVMCRYCPSKYNYSSSTTNFWRHVNLHHNVPIPVTKNIGTWSQSSTSHMLINDFLYQWNTAYYTSEFQYWWFTSVSQ